MKRIGFSLLCAVLVTGPAFAQSLAQPAAVSPQALVPAHEAVPPPPPVPVSPQQLALAGEVVHALQADKSIDAMTAQMRAMALQGRMVPPDATPEQKERFAKLQERTQQLTTETNQALKARLDQVFAEVYTEAELKGIKAFYDSPEGQAMRTKQPQVMKCVDRL